MERVHFTQMKDGSREEFEFLDRHAIEFAQGTADRLLQALAELDEGLSGYRISRLGHSVQSATRAWRDGADIDWVVCALLHDIGDIYAPYNHDEYAASILRPFVREQCAWCIQTHADFQMHFYVHHLGGNPNKRERFRDNPYFDDCAEFCERWDQCSFDPDYADLPLEFFAPLVREVFARTPNAPDVTRAGVRVPLGDRATAAQRASERVAER